MASRKPKANPYLIDEDTPPLTKKEIARLRPGHEVFAELGLEPPRPVGRPRAENPKVAVTLRLDADLLESLRASGKGWQTRVNAELRKALELDGKKR